MLVRHIVLSIFKIEDENRSGSLAAEQLCEKWTLTLQAQRVPVLEQKYPVSAKKFPATLDREFDAVIYLTKAEWRFMLSDIGESYDHERGVSGPYLSERGRRA
jgi:hypothetical protein